MLKIDLINVQSIEEAHLVFEDNSINEFVGNNSNGKSITSKVIEYLTKGDLIHKDVREALINDRAESAVILITLNNKQLGLILKHELKDSLVMYVPDIRRENEPNGKILRPLGDSQGLSNILHEFGFRVYNKGEICLQLAPTFGAIPFVTTGGSVNNDIVDDIAIDKVAQEFLESFSKITFPTFKRRVQQLTKEKEHYEDVLNNMESYDWKAYEELANRMDELYSAIRDYTDFYFGEIPIPPLGSLDIQEFRFKEIPMLELYDYPRLIPEMGKVFDDYVDILNSVCPTCKRPLFEHD